MPRTALALLILLSSSASLSAESLGQAAARERVRRETAVASPSRVISDEDLGKPAGQMLPDAASQLPSDNSPAASDPLPYGESPRQDAYRRHWTSAEAYLKQCETRLRAAKESWLAASEANQAEAATRAHIEWQRAASALERAREYRDQAEVAVRQAGALRAALR